ncbi:MAG TPA: hypothetical protein VGB79_01940 [Allosphingosinicella sp.]|jgi:uncharacterized membrane protein
MSRTPEDLIVGLFALALVPLIAMRIARGLREGRMPVYKTYLSREENGAKFAVLLTLHALSLVLIAVIAADLLLGLGLRDAL